MTTSTVPPRERADPAVPAEPRRERRTRIALVSTVVGLAIFNIARAHVIDAAAGVATNLLMAAALAGVCGYATLTPRELGTERARLRDGLRWGAATFAVVAAALAMAATIPALRAALDDPRVDVDTAGLLVQVLVTIPIGTVILEELAFRGLLLGLLRRVLSTGRAVAADSLLFGMWHIAPAIATSQQGGGSGVTGSTSPTVVATVATTFVAGLIFCWSRLRSRSLLAPAIAHVATNSVAFAVAWAVAR